MSARNDKAGNEGAEQRTEKEREHNFVRSFWRCYDDFGKQSAYSRLFVLYKGTKAETEKPPRREGALCWRSVFDGVRYANNGGSVLGPFAKKVDDFAGDLCIFLDFVKLFLYGIEALVDGGPFQSGTGRRSAAGLVRSWGFTSSLLPILYAGGTQTSMRRLHKVCAGTAPATIPAALPGWFRPVPGAIVRRGCWRARPGAEGWPLWG